MRFFSHYWKALLLTNLVIAIIYVIRSRNHTISKNDYDLYMQKSIRCYHIKSPTLPDISNTQPLKGQSIFFHETTCNSYVNGKIFIKARQACAVESAARLNPNFEIYLLFTSPGVFKFEGTESDRFLKALLSYKNVKIHHVDYERYTKNTPVERLYRNGDIEVSSYPKTHASDVLRFLTLYKYGGIYLDLDVIVMKSLETLPENYAGFQSPNYINAAVLNFSPTGLGHNLAKRCLDDLGRNFKGDDWDYNGPKVITRQLKHICKRQIGKKMLTKHCQGFRVFRKKAFYPIAYPDWKMYFEEESAEEVFKITKDSYIIHAWNNLSGNTTIPARGNSAYAIFAQKFCPKVIKQCGYFF